MNIKARILMTLITCFYSISLLTIPAYAYVDPSAVTYIIQLVTGIVIALGSVIVIFRHKIANLFRKKNGNNDDTSKKEIHLKDDIDE